MFFKLSILLIPFIMAASCTKTDPSKASSSAGPKEKTDAQIIEDSYNDFLRFMAEEIKHKVTPIVLGDCALYMGKITYNYQIIINYFDEHEDTNYEKIDLEQYSAIFNYYCNKRKLSVQDCATYLMLEETFEECLKWCSDGLEHKLEYINTDLFNYYIGGQKKDIEIIEEYFEDHTESIEKIEKIDLHLYCELLKYYCAREFRYLTLQRCAEAKKNLALLRPLMEVAPSRDHVIIAQKRVK